MPRSSSGGELVQIAAVGVFAWAVYVVAAPALQKAAKDAADKAAGAQSPSGTTNAPNKPAPSASNWRALSLSDYGGVPLESLGGRVRQSASWIAQYAAGSQDREYTASDAKAAGAVFFDGAGNTWLWQGGDTLLGPDVPNNDLSQTKSLGDFAV